MVKKVLLICLIVASLAAAACNKSEGQAGKKDPFDLWNACYVFLQLAGLAVVVFFPTAVTWLPSVVFN